MKIANVLLMAALIFSHTSCGPSPNDSETSTAVSENQVQQRIGLLNRKFNSEQLCKDYTLAHNLITYLQNDPIKKETNHEIECPKDYLDFANKLKTAISNFDDLHSATLAGYGLDSSSMPVVNACHLGERNEKCPTIEGSVVYAIPSPTEDAYYIAVYDSDKNIFFVRIETISNQNVHALAKQFKNKFIFSHSKQGFSEIFVSSFLTRSSIDNRSKSAFEMTGTDISSGQLLKIQLSYDDPQKIFILEQDKLILQNLTINRAYGCQQVFPGSTQDFGACVDSDKSAFLWLSAWPQRDSNFISSLREMLQWLSPKMAKDEIYFDLRGNMGGSPDSTIDFLCSIGNDEVLHKLNNTSLDVRYIPEDFDVLGNSIRSENIKFANNIQLKKVLLSFSGNLKMKTPPQSYRISIFEKTGLSIDECSNLRIEVSKNWKWRVLTNGREFSATEDFLFAIHKNKKFKTFGKSSVGGAGNPWWIELPETKASIRLSPARNIYANKVVIEKTGVRTDVFIYEWESKSEFESRLVYLAKNRVFYKPNEEVLLRTIKKIMKKPFGRD